MLFYIGSKMFFHKCLIFKGLEFFAVKNISTYLPK